MDFTRAVTPHLNAAYALARWLVRDPVLAEDVAQEAMLRALRYFPSWRGGDARPWLLQIVRNAAFDALRRRHGETHASLEEADDMPSEETGPEDAALARETALSVEAAIARLPVRLRECIVLREFEEFSYRDIATVTGVPIGTVMSRLSRARQTLARALEIHAAP